MSDLGSVGFVDIALLQGSPAALLDHLHLGLNLLLLDSHVGCFLVLLLLFEHHLLLHAGEDTFGLGGGNDLLKVATFNVFNFLLLSQLLGLLRLLLIPELLHVSANESFGFWLRVVLVGVQLVVHLGDFFIESHRLVLLLLL